MILDKNIQIKVTKKNIEHYSKLFVVKLGDILNINPFDLIPGSHKKINIKCDICNEENNIEFRDYMESFNCYGFFTCKHCNSIKTKKTKIEKYNNVGYHNIEKMKQTNLEKYGFENVFQNNDIKNKCKKTNLKKYGVEYSSQNIYSRIKYKETCLEKYGETHPLKNKEIFKKVRDTNLKKYGAEFYLKSDVYKEKRIKYLLKHYNLNVIEFDKSLYTILCDKCNKEYIIDNTQMLSRIEYKTEICTLCNPINSSCGSGYENQLSDFIHKNYNSTILLNDRKIIYPNELDIYLPDLKLAFEFNGIYWHSELKVLKNYHLNKTELAEQKGIHLIHIYEDDWIYKQEIVKSHILNLLGKTPTKFFAKKCIIKEISDNEVIRLFLVENHLQGFVDSQIKLGLFYDDELVSLMTFGSKCKFIKQNNNNVYKMLRFCNKLNTSIIGGLSKLFKYFIETYNPVKVVSYADRSWSQGDLCQKLGFTFISKTPPNYYYIVDNIRKHRFGYRKDVLIKQGFNTNLSEHEIMSERKIYRIYDSGSLKFTWPS